MNVYFRLDAENKVVHASESKEPWDNSGTHWISAPDKNSMSEILGLTYDSQTKTFT